MESEVTKDSKVSAGDLWPIVFYSGSDDQNKLPGTHKEFNK